MIDIEMPFHKKNFHEFVMKHVIEDGLTIYEAIIEICKEHDLDPEDVAPFIHGPLKEKLKNEIINRNILPSVKGNCLAGL